MLTVGIEKDYPRDFSTDPLLQSGFDCLAFAAVLIVNNYFGARFAGALCGLIARAVINHKNVVKSLAGPTYNVADMFFVLIRRNNRGCLRSYFCHVERNRGISKFTPEIPRLRFASLGMTTIASARVAPRIYSLIGAPLDENRPRDMSCGRADRTPRRENLFCARYRRNN